MSALQADELIIDLFAGGGGASEGIEDALDRHVDVAINHDAHAIRVHKRNHPRARHYLEDVWHVDPMEVTGGAPVGLLWASPDCTHHSRAKGGKPVDQGIRGLAWVVVRDPIDEDGHDHPGWCNTVRPRVVMLENVPEFEEWGPLLPSGKPDKARKGETFQRFVQALRAEGYVVEWRVLVAADYGAPTIRRRLYLKARRDGVPITWPEPTHGKGRAQPWRTAAECIDWSEPVPSIFERKKPLAEATQRRIAEGVRRYVLGERRPYLVNLSHGRRLESIDRPANTVTATPRGGDRMLVVPTIVQTGYGERDGQRPRVSDVGAPLGTLVGKAKHALTAVWLAKHFTGVVGHGVEQPTGSVTARDHHSLVAVHLTSYYSSAAAGRPVDEPAPTVTAGGGRGGGHAALVAAFLLRYHSTGGQWGAADAPAHTVTGTAGLALVEVVIDGVRYVVVDIGLRMLTPRELARVQSFPDSYVLEGSKAQKIARIGNSVCPVVAEALVRVEFGAVAVAA